LIDKSILSIDWDPLTLRIAQATVSKRSVRIDQVLSVPIAADVDRQNPESFGAFVGRALSQAKIRTKRAVVDIPREYANFYTLKLPKAPLNDLASMVAFQIPKELPYPVDQAAVDFSVAPEAEQEDTNDVLVAAVRHERLQFYTSVFEHAGLKLQRVGLRPNANEFAVAALLKATKRERVLFIDVGPVITEIDVLRNGRLVFSRAASVTIPEAFGPRAEARTVDASTDGGSDSVGGLSIVSRREEASLNEVVSEVMVEVTRSIEAYRAIDPGANLDHAVIGGCCDIEEALTDAIQRQYRMTAQPFNPATCFGWDADRGAAAGAFASTLGQILSLNEPTDRIFDFLKTKKPVTRTQQRIRRAPIVVATAVVFMAATAVFYFNFVKPQYDARDKLRKRIRDIKKTLAEHERFETMVATISQFEEDEIVWLDTLYELVSKLPDEKKIVLKNIEMKLKDRMVKIPYRASTSTVGSDLVKVYDGDDRLKASLNATSVKNKEGERYPNNGSVDIRISNATPEKG